MSDSIASSEDEKRQYFRLKYPADEKPKMIIEGENINEVLDISEHGIRIYYDANVVVNPVKAVITFLDRDSIAIEGKVVRINDGEIALYLSKGIPVSVVEKEQKYLEEKYGISQ